MKTLFRIHFILFILFIIAINGFGQDQEPERKPRVRRYRSTMFTGAGGGFMPFWLQPDVRALNRELKTSGLPELPKSMFLAGGGGFVPVGFLDNFRIGGMGAGGEYSVSQVSNKSLGEVEQEVQVSVGFGGLMLEYSLPIVEKFSLNFGAVLGGGSMTIEIFQNDAGFRTWQSTWDSLQTGSAIPSYNQRLKNNYFIYMPYVVAELSLSRIVALRVGAGWLGTGEGEWQINNERKLTGVPASLSANGVIIQGGVYFGYFPN